MIEVDTIYLWSLCAHTQLCAPTCVCTYTHAHTYTLTHAKCAFLALKDEHEMEEGHPGPGLEKKHPLQGCSVLLNAPTPEGGVSSNSLSSHVAWDEGTHLPAPQLLRL